MKKLKIISYVVSVFIVIYLLFGFLLLPIILKNQIIRNLDEKLVLNSQIEKIEFNPITFELTLNNYKLINKNNEENTILLKKLYIDVAFFKSLFNYELNIQNILADELVLNIKEEKDGFDIENILKENNKNKSSNSIKFLLNQINLSNSSINITSNKNYTIYLKEIDLDIKDLSNNNNITAQNNLNFKINQSDVNTIANIKLNPLDIDGKLNLKNLKIKDLTDFKKDLMNLSINEEANINSNINFKINDSKENNIKLNSDNVNINSLSFNFTDANSKIKVRSLNTNIDIKNFIFDNQKYKIGKIELNGPSIFIIMPKIASNSKIKTQINKEEKKANESKIKFEIGAVNIQNGTLNFEDKNLPIPFKTTVSKLNGNISQINSQNSTTSALKIDGTVNTYGVANITGTINPNNIKFLTNVNLIFKNIALKNFTPYSGKFLGRELKSGKLDLDLKYNIDKSNLDATNNITITKLELGKNIKSKDAISLPLEIAISLLEDENNVINIDIPVSGNVDAPEFSVGSIVWKAFSNLVSKSITAPFSLLAKAFNFDENKLASVRFDLNEEKITPMQKESLDKIAQILKVKKDLIIEIYPSYKKDKESQKIAINRISNIQDYLIKSKFINKNQIKINDKIKTENSSIQIDIKVK